MKISQTTLAALAAATLIAAAAGSASASSVFGVGGTLASTPPQNNVNEIAYHNYETVFSSTGAQLDSSVQIAPGDYIVGILTIDKISPPSSGTPTFGGAAGFPGGEITGVFLQKVVSITPTPTVLDPSQNTIVLGTATGVPALTDFGGNTITTGVNVAAGAMFSFYQDPSNDFVASGVGLTLQQSINSAKDGTSFFSLGLAANPAQNDPNAGYFYSTTDNLSPTNLALSGYGGLNFITNNTGSAFGTVFDSTAINAVGIGGPASPSEGFIIDSNISPNKAANTPWGFISSDPADVSVIVPVPAAAWTGMSMLAGLGCIAAIRRRKLANA